MRVDGNEPQIPRLHLLEEPRIPDRHQRRDHSRHLVWKREQEEVLRAVAAQFRLKPRQLPGQVPLDPLQQLVLLLFLHGRAPKVDLWIGRSRAQLAKRDRPFLRLFADPRRVHQGVLVAVVTIVRPDQDPRIIG